jgi:hypothetical protein
MTNTRTRSQVPIDETDDGYERFYRYSIYGTCLQEAGPADDMYYDYDYDDLVTHNYSKSMTDVVTPNYKKLSAQGRIINNPMTKTEVELIDPVLTYDLDVTRYVTGCTPVRRFIKYPYRWTAKLNLTQIMGGSPFKSADIELSETLADRATSKAWANITQAEVLGLATLKEIDKSFDGLLHLIRKVNRIAYAVRRKRYALLKKEITLKELEDVYMNARYNLRPIWYDLKGLLRILCNDIKPLRQTFRAKASDSEQVSDTLTDVEFMKNVSFCGYTRLRANILRTTSRSLSVRAGVLTQSKYVSNASLFGFDSLVDTAWDLLPFSFIIDWFFNVGDTILSWVPDFGIEPLTSWVVIKDTIIQTATVTDLYWWVNPSYDYDWEHSGDLPLPIATKTTTTYERIPNYERPVIPRWDLNLDPLKILDLGIILKNLAFNRQALKD